MKRKIGQYLSSIATLKLGPRTLRHSTLILAEEGSGKTHLANKIRAFVIDNDIPTLYLDFSDPDVDAVEARFKDENFFYMRFDETPEFEARLREAVEQRRHIYMAVNPGYFSNKRDDKSKLSHMFQMRELLDNYYYFFHEISRLNQFYTKFEDFLLYIFDLVNLKKFGLTFLTQPHEIFEGQQIKLLFTFLYLGKCSNADYYNTSVLKHLPKNRFYYQHRVSNKSLLFNDIKSDMVVIDD